MGLVDVISSEDRVQVKFSDFYALMKQSTRAELLMNGIKCETPHAYMREMMTGKKEEAAHTTGEISVHIKPVICGFGNLQEEKSGPLPWEEPGQEKEGAGQQGTTQDQEEKESEG